MKVTARVTGVPRANQRGPEPVPEAPLDVAPDRITVNVIDPRSGIEHETPTALGQSIRKVEVIADRK